MLSGARQACRRQDNLVSLQDMVVGGKITLAGARTTLSAASQGCWPANKVVSPQISLGDRKQRWLAADNLVADQTTLLDLQDKVVGGRITLSGARITLSAANQGCRPGNKVVSPQISLS